MTKSLVSALALTTLMSSSAFAFNIDGNVADWGVTQTGSSSAWNPTTGLVAGYAVEDQHDNYLSPGYGGQAYDAEALYIAYDSSNLYIALATGHNPLMGTSGGPSGYAAGDFAIDFGKNGSWDFGVETTGSNGMTQGHVYSNVNWMLGQAYPSSAHPASILGGTDVGAGSVVYTTTPATGYGSWTGDQHYFYEVSVPLTAFGNNWANNNEFVVHWTMNCANDAIQASAAINGAGGNNLPEPGTLTLLPLGLIGIAALRRNRKTA